MEEYYHVTMYNYSKVYKFESDFIHQHGRIWMQKNWTWGFYYVGLYILFIFGAQYIMKSHRRFELRGALCLWNTLLAMFSLMGAYRTLPEFLHVLTQHGFSASVCDHSFIEHKASAFWVHMFVLSKLPELGDTVFIVLRKQPLIFLHWYHHVTVLLYSWFSLTEYSSTARWFIVMNYCVHSIMYSYFAFKAWGYTPPKQVAMVITTLQLLQMVLGAAVNIRAFQLLQQGAECHITLLNITVAMVIYLSYLILFARLFYVAYISTGNKKKNGALPTADHRLNK